MREILMDPSADQIAFAMHGDPGIGSGVAAGTYTFFTPEREQTIADEVACTSSACARTACTARRRLPLVPGAIESSPRSRCQATNVCRELRELWLIEFVPALGQGPDLGVGQETAIAFQVFEWDLGVVTAVVEIDRRYVAKARGRVRGERKFWKVCPPKWGCGEKEASESGSAHGLREVLQKH